MAASAWTRRLLGRARVNAQRLAKGHVGLLWERPGRFYSPIPSPADLRRDDARIWAVPGEIPGLDLNEEGQLSVLAEVERYYPDLPFPEEPDPAFRYHLGASFYPYGDGITYYGMLRHFRPERLVEVGAGFSTALAIDVNERFLDGRTSITAIDPYPDVLLSLLRAGDLERLDLRRQRVQDTDLAVFDRLSENDILFIDSSHVTKTGSDVNHLVFEVLPRLRPGVLVHFHDVPYPFEYPKWWALEGRAWNEAYLLRAFLQYNDRFRIVLFTTYLQHFHRQRFEERMPLALKGRSGSIWLRRQPNPTGPGGKNVTS